MKNITSKKIGFFMVPYLPAAYGVGMYFINLAKRFADKGGFVEIVTLNQSFLYFLGRLLDIYYRFNFFGKTGEKTWQDESIIRVQLGKASWKTVRIKNLASQLKRYDVLYVKNEILDLLFVKLMGYRNLPPVIVGVHTPLHYPITRTLHERIHNFLYKSIFYKFLISGAKVIHTSNSFERDFCVANYGIKTAFVYYPFSVDDFVVKVKEETTDYYDKDRYNICFVGRMVEQKGLPSLESIVVGITKNHNLSKKIRINIFGDGALSSIPRRLSEEYDFVKYFGYVDQNRIPGILNSQNMLVSTSLWETLPFNILEAQAIGLPVIAFDIPGPRDIVIDGKTGFLVNEISEFIKKIEFCLNSNTVFNKTNISDHIRQKFNPEVITDALYDIFLIEIKS